MIGFGVLDKVNLADLSHSSIQHNAGLGQAWDYQDRHTLSLPSDYQDRNTMQDSAM